MFGNSLMPKVTRDDIEVRKLRNGVFDALRNSTFAPNDFEWTESAGTSTVRTLVHKPTNAQFDFTDGTFKRPEGSAGEDRWEGFEQRETRWPEAKANFESWLSLISSWLREVDDFHNTPDLWETVQEEEHIISAADNQTDNSPFTVEEQMYIAGQLTELKRYIISTIRSFSTVCLSI